VDTPVGKQTREHDDLDAALVLRPTHWWPRWPPQAIAATTLLTLRHRTEKWFCGGIMPSERI
jgi:hypothetical protein